MQNYADFLTSPNFLSYHCVSVMLFLCYRYVIIKLSLGYRQSDLNIYVAMTERFMHLLLLLTCICLLFTEKKFLN